MPYKTRYGSHYHMTEGCCGATEPCSSTEGLAPCSICCGGSEPGGGGGVPGTTGAGGIPHGLADPQGDGTPIADADMEGASATEPADAQDAVHAAKRLSEEGTDILRNGATMPDSLSGMSPEQVAEALRETEVAAIVQGIEDSDRRRRELVVKVANDISRLRGIWKEYEQASMSTAGRRFVYSASQDFRAWCAEAEEFAAADPWMRGRAHRDARAAMRELPGLDGMSEEEQQAEYERLYAIEIRRQHARGWTAPPHGIPAETDPSWDSLSAAIVSKSREYREHMSRRKQRLQDEWETQKLAHPEPTVERYLREGDAARVADELYGEEHERRRQTLDAAQMPGAKPVPHKGVDYEQIDGRALAEACAAGAASPTVAVKRAKVLVRPAIAGEEIVTYAGDGTAESVAAGKEGSYVLTKLDPDGNVMLDENGHPNEWQVAGDKMRKGYDLGEPDGEGHARAVSKPAKVQLLRVDRDIVIMVPWGEDGALVPQYIRKGGYLNVTDPDDVYGISEQDFNDTYRRADGVRHVPPMP